MEKQNNSQYKIVQSYQNQLNNYYHSTNKNQINAIQSLSSDNKNNNIVSYDYIDSSIGGGGNLIDDRQIDAYHACLLQDGQDNNNTSIYQNQIQDYESQQSQQHIKKHGKIIQSKIKHKSIKKQMKIQKYEYKYEGQEKMKKKIKKRRQRRRQVNRKTLEMLSKKFDDYYAYQNSFNYNGPKMCLRQIGQIFDLGNSTIHKLYTQWLDDPTFYDRINRVEMKLRIPQRRITNDRLQHVSRLIRQNPFLTQNQITVQLNKIQDLKFIKDGFRKQITRTTVGRLLKSGKFRKKRVKCVPTERNTSKSLDKRYQYCTKYKSIVKSCAKVYFLDQSGFNLYMTRDKAWTRPNQEVTVNCPISKGKRFSLIAIISNEGLAHWRIIQGTFRKYEYLQFIKELFKKLDEYQKIENPINEKYLILDNCAIHDKQQTIQLSKICNIKIQFLPPYSPQLNPIQNWFHEVKSKVRKINYSGQKQLLEIMQRTLKNYQQHDFCNYYHGIMKHVEKGIRKERF